MLDHMLAAASEFTIQPDPLAPAIKCWECDFVIIGSMSTEDQQVEIEAQVGHNLFWDGDRPLCSECVPNNESEVEFVKADIALDAWKDGDE